MSLSWINRKRSLEISPRARLVDDVEAEALLRKIESLQWRPENGFLKDGSTGRNDLLEERADRAA
jgi:hypothetical protein